MARIEIYTESACTICRRAVLMLDELGFAYDEISVDGDKARRSEMVMRSVGRRNVPQIFIEDQHIGSLDELMAMEETGELRNLLEPAA